MSCSRRKKSESSQASGVATSSSVPVGMLTRKKTLLIAGSLLVVLLVSIVCIVSWGFYLQKDKQNVQVASSDKQDKKLPVNVITKNTMNTNASSTADTTPLELLRESLFDLKPDVLLLQSPIRNG